MKMCVEHSNKNFGLMPKWEYEQNNMHFFHYSINLFALVTFSMKALPCANIPIVPIEFISWLINFLVIFERKIDV